jgi:hypothetical protein
MTLWCCLLPQVGGATYNLTAPAVTGNQLSTCQGQQQGQTAGAPGQQPQNPRAAGTPAGSPPAADNARGLGGNANGPVVPQTGLTAHSVVPMHMMLLVVVFATIVVHMI